MGERASVGVAVLGVLIAVLACKPKDTGDFAVIPAAEPRGTCAVEGYLRGDRPAKDAYPVTIVLSWTDPVTHAAATELYPVTATEHRFRVEGLSCDGGRDYGISAYTDDERGAALYSTIGGNSAWLHASPGDRLSNVRLDLQKGTTFKGTVKDASGAPLAGARVAAIYPTYGRDGWSPPHEFTATNAKGEYVLSGVESAKLDQTSPKLSVSKAGYAPLEIPAPSGGGTADAVLAK